MARQDLNLGTNANDGTGDRLRNAMKKVNENFIELYTRTGGDGNQSIELLNGTLSCNGNLTITTNDTGSITLDDETNINANLTVFSHLRINTAEADPINNLLVNGNAKIKGNTILGDDAGTDKITLNSSISGPIIPSLDGVYDLGTPSLRFRDIYVGGVLRASNVLFGNVNITGGSINNTIIGNNEPSEASFTRITVTGDSRLGNFLIRDNMIATQNPDGGIELRTNGNGNVYIPSALIVGTGINTGAQAQVNGSITVTENASVTGNVNIAGVTELNVANVSGDVNANGNLTASQVISTVADGQPPFVVYSSTPVANLKVGLADYSYTSGSADIVSTSSQPVITEIGTLTYLNVAGTTTVNGNVNIVGNLDVSEGRITGDRVNMTYIIDGGGETISVGSKKYIGPLSFGGKFVSATLVADQVGSIEIDIRKCDFRDFDAGITHPVAADSIVGTSPLTISSAARSRDDQFLNWTDVYFIEDDMFEFYVNSATNITWIQIILTFTKGS